VNDAAKQAAPVGTIRVAELKTKSMPYAVQRLKEARQAGKPSLEVLNRGRAIMHLGLPEEVPGRWRTDKPRTLPYADIRSGRVSNTGLARSGEVILLTQRRGPSLAFWPLDEEQERPPARTLPERVQRLEHQVRRLDRRLEKVETLLDLIRILMEGRGRFEKAGPESMGSDADNSGMDG
jgi:hypothetical protein